MGLSARRRSRRSKYIRMRGVAMMSEKGGRKVQGKTRRREEKMKAVALDRRRDGDSARNTVEMENKL